MSERLLVTCVILAMCAPLYGQEEGSPLKVGDLAPGLGFDKVLQAPEGAKVTLEALQGKVIVVHFWGPHAQPCIDAFSHLNRLAKKFQGKPIQFIAITSAEEDTVRKFADITPIEGWIGIDRDFWIFSLYYASPVPHVVVIDKEARVAAIVRPEDLTEAALGDVLAGKTVSLPTKPGKWVKPTWKPGKTEDEPEPILQIAIAPSMSSFGGIEFSSDKTGRRLTAKGAPLAYLVTTAYRAEPARVVWKLPPSYEAYRVSLVVPKTLENSIYSMLQEALDSTFNLKVTWQKRSVQCLVLKRDESVPLRLAQSGNSKKTKGESKGGGKDDGEGRTRFGYGVVSFSKVNMAGVASGLEAVLRVPVIDETEIEGRFDLKLRYKPGDVGQLKAAVKELGLRFEEDQRQIKLLIVDKADEDA
jgi:uncharacterized protein (TIGR03435 family)